MAHQVHQTPSLTATSVRHLTFPQPPCRSVSSSRDVRRSLAEYFTTFRKDSLPSSSETSILLLVSEDKGITNLRKACSSSPQRFSAYPRRLELSFVLASFHHINPASPSEIFPQKFQIKFCMHVRQAVTKWLEHLALIEAVRARFPVVHVWFESQESSPRRFFLRVRRLSLGNIGLPVDNIWGTLYSTTFFNV
jgi:hypothetical protein